MVSYVELEPGGLASGLGEFGYCVVDVFLVLIGDDDFCAVLYEVACGFAAEA